MTGQRPVPDAPAAAPDTGAVTIAVLGLGEAGSLFASGLAAAGATVRGYDPRVPAPDGIQAASSDADACAGADVVLSLNSAADALDALRQGLPGCGTDVLWADLNTAAPGRKRELYEAAAGRVRVVDVAIMTPVPPAGVATPLLASGHGAEQFARTLRRFGARVSVLDAPVGAAATRKLLRSVFYKGMAAAAVEALEAARAAGLRDWLADHIRDELDRTSAATLDRMIDGSVTHAVRRGHEMAAAAELLDALDVPARVARASRDWLSDLATDPPGSAAAGEAGVAGPPVPRRPSGSAHR